jgi:hypothetical protein
LQLFTVHALPSSQITGWEKSHPLTGSQLFWVHALPSSQITD